MFKSFLYIYLKCKKLKCTLILAIKGKEGKQHYIVLTLEVLKYCINARGVLNLWTLEMSNKVYEILTCVRDTF